MSAYRVIVADPPWDIAAKRTGVGHLGRRSEMPYPPMTTDAIMQVPVGQMTAPDSVLYLWAVQSRLLDAYRVLAAWGFRSAMVLVWSKAPRGVVRGEYVGSAEFILYAKRGQPTGNGQQMGSVFTWPRGQHSAKPDAFLDMVESLHDGPYLEMFARRARFGWDYWGNESLETAALA